MQSFASLAANEVFLNMSPIVSLCSCAGKKLPPEVLVPSYGADTINLRNSKDKKKKGRCCWPRLKVVTSPLSILRLFSHDSKVRILNFNSRCAFWIKIQNTQKRLCVCQITSQNVIWNAHLKSRYRGVFQLRFSQITQQNHLQSWQGCKGNVNNTRACLIGRQPRHSHASSPRSRKENHIFGHSCV